MIDEKDPPPDGEGDQPQAGGGGPAILHAPIKHVKRARTLRKELSFPEVLLWKALRNRPGGFKFRRQFPRPPYVVDFACLECRLAIEIDGEAHNRGDRPAGDEVRDRILATEGFRMMRIAAGAVLNDIDGVIEGIVSACRKVGPLHRPGGGPPPGSGEDF